jgi:hypothetical protein
MSDSRNLLKKSWRAARRHPRLWLAQLLGNLFLASLFYAWLWIPEEEWWHLAGSALLGLVILAMAIALHASTILVLHWSRTSRESCGARFLEYNFLWLIPVGVMSAVLLAVCLWFVRGLEEEEYSLAAWISSALTRWLQQPISPESVLAFTDHAWWIGLWVLVVLIWLPLTVALVSRGMGAEGMRATVRGWLSLRYWLYALLILASCSFLPWQLAYWVPEINGVFVESLSALGRVGLAYAVGIFGWIWLLAAAEAQVNRDLPDAGELGEAEALQTEISPAPIKS